MPVCGRCKRRRVTPEWIYDPSPTEPSSTMRKSTTNMNLSLKLQSPDDYQVFVAGSAYVEKCLNGFLGPTAYSTIFSEH